MNEVLANFLIVLNFYCAMQYGLQTNQSIGNCWSSKSQVPINDYNICSSWLAYKLQVIFRIIQRCEQ